MFTLTHEKSGTTATTSDINVCKGIAFALLEAIGQDNGVFTISDGERTICVVYFKGKYGIGHDVFENIYDASDAITYGLEQMIS